MSLYQRLKKEPLNLFRGFLLLVFLSTGLRAQEFQPDAKWDYLVTIGTAYGEMKAILYDGTPKHKANFLKLAGEGFYDSLLFHRVMKDFMIQGGDPDSRNAAPGARLGRGDMKYRIPAEFDKRYFHKKGALAAARKGDSVNPSKASSGSQFYIVQGKIEPDSILRQPNTQAISAALEKLRADYTTNGLFQEFSEAFSTGGQLGFKNKVLERLDTLASLTGVNMKIPEERIPVYSSIGGTPSLDDNYTVFGEVIQGLAAIDSIVQVKTDRADRPLDDVKMWVKVERIKRKKLVKQYGYTYY